MAGIRSEQKESTRRKILDHARQVVIAGGAEALTIAPLMSALGLTHGGFYAHFSSREDLVDHVVGEMCSRALDGFAEEAAQHVPRVSLERYIDGYLSPKHRDAKELGCPLAYLSRDIPQMSHTARGYYAEAHQEMVRVFGDLLRRAGARDVSALSQSLVAELVGALSIARALGETDRSAAVLRASRKRLKVRISDAVSAKATTVR